MSRKLLAAAAALVGMMALNTPAIAANSNGLKDRIFSHLVQICISDTGMTEEGCVTRTKRKMATWQSIADSNFETCSSSGKSVGECDDGHDIFWARMQAIIVK